MAQREQKSISVAEFKEMATITDNFKVEEINEALAILRQGANLTSPNLVANQYNKQNYILKSETIEHFKVDPKPTIVLLKKRTKLSTVNIIVNSKINKFMLASILDMVTRAKLTPEYATKAIRIDDMMMSSIFCSISASFVELNGMHVDLSKLLEEEYKLIRSDNDFAEKQEDLDNFLKSMQELDTDFYLYPVGITHWATNEFKIKWNLHCKVNVYKGEKQLRSPLEYILFSNLIDIGKQVKSIVSRSTTISSFFLTRIVNKDKRKELCNIFQIEPDWISEFNKLKVRELVEREYIDEPIVKGGDGESNKTRPLTNAERSLAWDKFVLDKSE